MGGTYEEYKPHSVGGHEEQDELRGSRPDL
jgi:hypothetical protein